ncbi:glucose-1-phosphatase-like [Galleria mellonella]|uniref:Glucose-1-phosphatase-like n=1 Tax=Galleria mellonella TaxID=7137 RepID=A0A6J1WVV4_GALME|nr:glucose-1-phosphatase-like [Galleria mellonella]
MYIIKYFLFFCASITIVNTEKRFYMKQVIILSRHNLRTPLSKYLEIMTPKTWPAWKEKSGYLTAKGALLEGYMGGFFSDWLKEESVLSSGCPAEDVFYAYANIKQRTIASAEAFVNRAFPNCNITIHYSSTVDPIFNPVIHNKTAAFKDYVIKEMKAHLKSLKLNDSYDLLGNILDYNHSKLCETNHQCNLKTDKNNIIVVPDEKPNLWGPIKIGNSVVDAFVMQYYEGFPINIVAWGYLYDQEQWGKIMPLSRGFHNVIFNTSLVAKDIAKPLIKYIADLCLGHNVAPKVTLLMGHDANMYTLLEGMGFKPYSLINQHELVPVGGKIVFQKWYDAVSRQNFLKINFIYQSMKQLRDSVPLSLSNPPQFELLELENCKVDSNGFCLWNVFEDFLKTLIQ